MESLLAGRSPSTRHDGSAFTPVDTASRLPPGTTVPRAALLQLRGGWEWLTHCFRFRSPSSERFCFKCDATKTGAYTYHNFTPTAPHRRTLINHDTYLTRCTEEGREVCGLFLVTGVLLEHICIDSMHSANLGCFADALGSLFLCGDHGQD